MRVNKRDISFSIFFTLSLFHIVFYFLLAALVVILWVCFIRPLSVCVFHLSFCLHIATFRHVNNSWQDDRMLRWLQSPHVHTLCMCVQGYNAIWKAYPLLPGLGEGDQRLWQHMPILCVEQCKQAGSRSSEVFCRCRREGPFCSSVSWTRYPQSCLSRCQMDPCFSPHSCSHS